MKAEIEGEIHEVIYIDYNGKVPHSVITSCLIERAEDPYYRPFYWDFFANNGDESDIRYYESGSGGNLEVDAPQWGEGYCGKFWLSGKIKLKGGVKNGIRLTKPLRLKGYLGETSINPFKISEITFSRDYCDLCEHESTEFCDEHKYIDDNGVERYRHNDSYAE